MGKVIGHIYKYDRRNWPYPLPNTPFVMLQNFETCIKTQHTSAYDAYVGAHALAYSGLDQSTNHHGNTDVNNNCDSQ